MHIKMSKFEHIQGTEEVKTLSQTVKLEPRRFERMEKMGGFANWDKVEIRHDGRVKPEAKKTTKKADADKK